MKRGRAAPWASVALPMVTVAVTVVVCWFVVPEPTKMLVSDAMRVLGNAADSVEDAVGLLARTLLHRLVTR